MKIPFTLTPHGIAVKKSPFELIGSLQRKEELLSLEYSLRGPIHELVWPQPSLHPVRKNELWKHVCFELFVGSKSDRHYWEFNFSPSGDWNAYSFTDYREGMKEESVLLPTSQKWTSDSSGVKFQTEIRLDSRKFDVGVTAVLEHANHSLSYWALNHLDAKPNFHLRKSFTLSI